MSGDIIDLIVIGVILLIGIIGTIRGFFKSFLSLFGFLGAIIVSIIFREQIAELLESVLGLESMIEEFVIKKTGEINAELINYKTADSSSLITMVNGLELNVILKGIFIKIISGATILEPVSAAEIIASPIAHYITIAVGVVIATVLIRVLVLILNATLGKLAKGKVFGRFNRLLGFIFGSLKGVLLVAVIMGLTTVLSLFPSVNNFVTPYIESTTITKFCYEKVNNFVLEKLSGFDIEEITGAVENPEIEN